MGSCCFCCSPHSTDQYETLDEDEYKSVAFSLIRLLVCSNLPRREANCKKRTYAQSPQ